MREWIVTTLDADDRVSANWSVMTYEYINGQSALADAIQAAAYVLSQTEVWELFYDSRPVTLDDLARYANGDTLQKCGIYEIVRSYPTLIYTDGPLEGQEGF